MAGNLTDLISRRPELLYMPLAALGGGVLGGPIGAIVGGLGGLGFGKTVGGIQEEEALAAITKLMEETAAAEKNRAARVPKNVMDVFHKPTQNRML